jgi:hypothetical protein
MYASHNNQVVGSPDFLRDLKFMFHQHPHSEFLANNCHIDPGTDFLKTTISFSFILPNKVLNNHKSPSEIARDKLRSQNYRQKQRSKHSATPSPEPQPTPSRPGGQQGSANNSKPHSSTTSPVLATQPISSEIPVLVNSPSVSTTAPHLVQPISASSSTDTTSLISASSDAKTTPILEPTLQPTQPVNKPQSQQDSIRSTSSLLDRAQRSLLLPRKTTCGAPTPIPTSNKYEVLNNGFTDDHASEIKRGVVETTAPSAMPPHAPHREVKIREVFTPTQC